MKHFEKANVEYYKARKKLSAAIKQSFPVGAYVYYDFGDHEREGQVISYDYFDRVKIKSPHDKEVWIQASSIKRVRK